MRTSRAAVRVPASTSNLGAGFDTLGMAVRRYLSARWEPGESPLAVERAGTLSDLGLPIEEDLLARAFQGELARRGVVGAATGTLIVTSEIPLARGLGTSAAATVAGLLLASAASGNPEPDREALLARAVELEGHGDNAAPALFGGLVAVVPGPAGGVRALRQALSGGLAFVYAAPSTRVSTAEARRALPDAYARRTTFDALGRLAALLHGLAHADPAALATGFTDELHVPYRLPLIRGGAEALEAAREAGAWGATISGSGSGLIAVCTPLRSGAVGSAMLAALRRAGHDEVVTFPLEPDLSGAQLLDAGAQP